MSEGTLASACRACLFIVALLCRLPAVADTPIESLRREELNALICPSDLLNASDDHSRAPCNDKHYGGCVARECEALFNKAATSQSPADHEAWESLCGTPSCAILAVTDEQRAVWRQHQLDRSSQCALPPAPLTSVLLPGEATREDLECWRKHERFRSIARENAQARCAVNGAGSQPCPAAPCPIAPSATQALMTVKQAWCEYEEPEGRYVYACQGSARKKKMGAMCPIQHVDARSTPDTACALIVGPLQVKALLQREATVVHMSPWWEETSPGGRSAALPGVALPSFASISTTRHTRWAECSTQAGCEALGADRVGWWQLARTLESDPSFFAIHLRDRSAQPTVTALPAWRAEDFNSLSNCSGDLDRRHLCDWSNLQIELLAAEPRWTPTSAIVPGLSSTEARRSVRCFENGPQDACIEHTTYAPARVAGLGTRPTTRTWSPMHDGWQGTSAAPRARTRSLLTRLLASQPGHDWRLVATTRVASDRLVAVVHDGEQSFLKIEEQAEDITTGITTPTPLAKVLSRSLQQLTVDGSDDAKLQAEFALEALLAHPERSVTTEVVERQRRYALCWRQGMSAIDCLRSDALGPWRALDDTSLSALLSADRRSRVMANLVADEKVGEGAGAQITVLRHVEHLLQGTDARFSIADVIGEESRALTLYTQGMNLSGASSQGCRWEGRMKNATTELPLSILVPAEPASSCTSALQMAYQRVRDNEDELLDRLLTAQRLNSREVWLLLPLETKYGAEALVVAQHGAAAGKRLSASRLMKDCGWASSYDILERHNRGLPTGKLQVPLNTVTEEIGFMQQVAFLTQGFEQSASVLLECGHAGQ